MTVGIVWFRRDLRLADNPALARALAACERVYPVYIHAPEEAGEWAPGAASRWWLNHSLAALGRDLERRGSRLSLFRGPSLETLRQVAEKTGASYVFWNRLYEPRLAERDKGVEEALRDDGVTVQSFNGSLLFEPWDRSRENGGSYKVFTPFWKACIHAGFPSPRHLAPRELPPVPASLGSVDLSELDLLPRVPWDRGLRETWKVGEGAAIERLEAFLDHAVAHYDRDRNRPDLFGTSRLSPHLHFGEISPRQVVEMARRRADSRSGEGLVRGSESFIREVGWREFAFHILHHFPQTPTEPLDERFRAFSWAQRYGPALRGWQRGETGIPLVDAGMRELWSTGWMHNRVRMIVASLLTKNLLIPWQEGARWFWDTLVDADLANNTLGWQWTAGCGADAAPYFRIFNPVLQGEKFDPRGDYVRRWVPEVAGLPEAYVQKPWKAPDNVLSQAGVRPGRDYPAPLVDLKATRERALERVQKIKRLR